MGQSFSPPPPIPPPLVLLSDPPPSLPPSLVQQPTPQVFSLLFPSSLIWFVLFVKDSWLLVPKEKVRLCGAGAAK